MIGSPGTRGCVGLLYTAFRRALGFQLAAHVLKRGHDANIAAPCHFALMGGDKFPRCGEFSGAPPAAAVDIGRFVNAKRRPRLSDGRPGEPLTRPFPHQFIGGKL
jgi:hypothetical protein